MDIFEYYYNKIITPFSYIHNNDTINKYYEENYKHKILSAFNLKQRYLLLLIITVLPNIIIKSNLRKLFSSFVIYNTLNKFILIDIYDNNYLKDNQDDIDLINQENYKNNIKEINKLIS